jgi:hypothetical protein
MNPINVLLDRPLVWMVVLIAALWAAAEYRQSVVVQVQSRQDYVQQVCDNARAKPASDAFTACYAAQARSHTEYLCNGAGGAHCWTEVK